jgi:hypothetical protein
MKKADKARLPLVRKEFEAWVGNEFMTDLSERPDSWCRCSKKEIDEWELAPYDHPWTNGAWEAWKKFNGLPRKKELGEE